MAKSKAKSCDPTAKLFKPRKTVLSVLLGVKQLFTKYPERWVRGQWQANGRGKEVDRMLACRHCAQGACEVIAGEYRTGPLAGAAIAALDRAAYDLYGQTDIVEVNDSKSKKFGRVGVLKALNYAIKNVRKQQREARG